MKKTDKKPMRRKSKGSRKGSEFEREVCKQLSLWWTHGQRTDIFWRTSGSGARAKVRGKKQKRTFGQYGDVQATDPLGQPLIDLFTIEIKRGYDSATISDFLDQVRRKRHTKPLLQTFLEQIVGDSELRAETPDWILLMKRDYKETLLFIPLRIWNALTNKCAESDFPTIRMRIQILNRWRIIVIMRFRDFLRVVTPRTVRRLYRQT